MQGIKIPKEWQWKQGDEAWKGEVLAYKYDVAGDVSIHYARNDATSRVRVERSIYVTLI